MLRLLQLLLLVAGVAAQTTVTIYTKNFAPFSDAGEGFSIEYAKRMLDDTHRAASVTTTVTVLTDNTAVMNAVLAHPNTDNNYAIGTAGISITKDREEKIDFLPSFFNSGFQVMVRNERNWAEYLGKLATALGVSIAVIVIIAFFVTAFIAPLAWMIEFKYSPEGTSPKFMDWYSRDQLVAKGGFTATILGVTFDLPSKARLMVSEFTNALKWSAYTLGGTQTGYPNSMGARVIHGFLKLCNKLLFLLSIPILTNVLWSVSTPSQITRYAEVRETSVCTVVGSTSEEYLDNNNLGFGVLRTATVKDMFTNFFDYDTCDVVVYDFPALRQSIKARGDDAGAHIVGPTFVPDQYGVVISPTLSTNLHELLRVTSVQLTRNTSYMESLERKWLASAEDTDVGPKNQYNPPALLIMLPFVIAIGISALSIAAVYAGYNKKIANYTDVRAAVSDTMYDNDLREVLKKESQNHYIYQGVDQIVDGVLAPYSLRNTRVLYEIYLTLKGYDVAAIEQDLVPGRPPVSPPRVGADVESGWARTGKDGGAGVQMQQLGANKAE